MQKWDDNHPVWDLVLCIGGCAGTAVCFFWAVLLLNPYVPVFFVDRRIASLVCIILAALMLSSAAGYWHLWKARH